MARRREKGRGRVDFPAVQTKAGWDAARSGVRRPTVDMGAADMGPTGVARQHARQLQLARTPAVAGVEGRLADRDSPAGGTELRRYGGSEGAFSAACDQARVGSDPRM